MLPWIRIHRGSVAAAIAIAAVLIGLWLVPIVRQRQSTGWAPMASAPMTADPPHSSAQRTGAEATSPSQASHATGLDADTMARSGPIGPEQPAATATHPEQSLDASVPAFDVVRVDPHGDAVIAGRAAPGAEVALVDGGKVLAKVMADAGGQFVLLPPALVVGEHYLTLQVSRDGGTVLSTQGVAVSVAPDASKPMVAVLTPDQPARVLSDGGPAATTASGVPIATKATASAAPRPVAIQSVETGGRGTFTASGVAKAGSQCRLYLNGAFLADVTTGVDGRWSVKVEKGMKTGRYTVRADQLADVTGTVVDRAEVPFDFPATVAIGHAKQLLMAHSFPAGAGQRQGGTSNLGSPNAAPDATPTTSLDDAAAAAIVKDVQSATVVHGDSLWRISRKMLGHGINYTEIYASNVGQIRNPRMIYPGQIFVLPHRPTREGRATP